MSTYNKIEGRYQVVVGLGLTGLSCARYFSAQEIDFVVVDSRESPPFLKEFVQCCPGVSVYLGDWHEDILLDASELTVSPGIALSEPAIKKAVSAGVKISGDIDIFCRNRQAPVIAITGTNAKSTVTTLVGSMGEAAGLKVSVGGNIGIPALDLLEKSTDLYVLELSSFQLERTSELKSLAATVLNLSPDHLDRHKNFEHYVELKRHIYDGCNKALFNRDEYLTRPLEEQSADIYSFGLDDPGDDGFGIRELGAVEWLVDGSRALIPVSDIAMEGAHNISNALAALALGHAAGLPLNAMLKVLKTFPGLPHRCQLVAIHSGVRYINDSKGTNVGASIAALEGLRGGPNIVLIAGGQAKDDDFSLLIDSISASCKAVVLIGEAAPQLGALLERKIRVSYALSMKAAVSVAEKLSVSGDVVLLSPACASFDMFNGFEDRGQKFIEAVDQVSGEIKE